MLLRVRDKINPVVHKGVTTRDAEYIEAQVEVRNADPSIQHLKFLYEPYEGQFWWWESLECIR